MKENAEARNQEKFERIIAINVLIVFLVSYILAYFAHLYILHPITTPADGVFDPTTVFPEYAGTEALIPLDETTELYVLGKDDGSRIIILFEDMNGRKRFLKDTTVPANYTGSVEITFFGGKDIVEFTNGQVTQISGTGNSFILGTTLCYIIYAVVAALITALETFLLYHFLKKRKESPAS